MSDSSSVDRDAVIQYKTNNDGTINSISAARGPVPPDLQQQLDDAKAAAAADDDPLTDDSTAIKEVMSAQPDCVWISRTGTYYKGKVAKYFGDSEVISPSPLLLQLLDEFGEIGVDKANDMIAHISAAHGGDTQAVLAAVNDAAGVPAGTTVNPKADAGDLKETQKQ